MHITNKNIEETYAQGRGWSPLNLACTLKNLYDLCGTGVSMVCIEGADYSLAEALSEARAESEWNAPIDTFVIYR